MLRRVGDYDVSPWPFLVVRDDAGTVVVASRLTVISLARSVKLSKAFCELDCGACVEQADWITAKAMITINFFISTSLVCDAPSALYRVHAVVL